MTSALIYRCQRQMGVSGRRFYLINTKTACNTPAVPVHTEGPVFTKESCINKPTDAARDTNATT